MFLRCSVDPYLFENFNTVDGDFLSAKFRAFKFPESTYVQFKGTVNVCLDKCRGVSIFICHILSPITTLLLFNLYFQWALMSDNFRYRVPYEKCNNYVCIKYTLSLFVETLDIK